ncbi:MAG: nucleotidyl transferase AbiEii/AbiGii toxin family protein [Bryobacterales bacterium]|nr:nucleotidyl transferase AbiEii/AbiGii toxin family protein [Bryobacterales bacterium]
MRSRTAGIDIPRIWTWTEKRPQIRAAARAAGVKIVSIRRRDGKSRQQFRARYRSRPDSSPETLKVDYHYRQPPKSRYTHVVAGILTYRVEVLFDQKMAAAENRVEARDLFDLAFLMGAYGDQMTDDQVRQTGAFLAVPETVEERYADPFIDDPIIREITTAKRTVVNLRGATARQRRVRWPHQMQQRIPVPLAVLGHALVYENKQRLRALGQTASSPMRTPVRPTYRHMSRRPYRSGSPSRSDDRDHSPSR